MTMTFGHHVNRSVREMSQRPIYLAIFLLSSYLRKSVKKRLFTRRDLECFAFVFDVKMLHECLVTQALKVILNEEIDGDINYWIKYDIDVEERSMSG